MANLKLKKTGFNRVLRKVLAIFLATNLALLGKFSPAAFATPPLEPPASLQLPKSMGQVEESFKGSSGKTLIYLQDAHTILDAQESIAKIIHHLVEVEKIPVVFEEGYEGPVPSDQYFGWIKDEKVRERISYELMDELRIGGAEYAHINRAEPFDLVGVDESRLYERNVLLYQQAAQYQGRVDQDLEEIYAQVRVLMNQSFPKEMKIWMKLKKRFDTGSLGLYEYLNRSLVVLDFDRTVLEARYPSLAVFERVSKKEGAFQSISAKQVFEEIQRFEIEASTKILKTKRDQQVFKLHQQLMLLKKLNHIELTSAEYEAVKSSLQSFSTEKAARLIVGELHKTRVFSKKWETLIQKAIQFYETAYARDDALVRNVEAYFEHSNVQNGILVFGGFHKDRIKQMLREKQISYFVVAPKVSQIEDRHQSLYKEKMKVGHQAYGSASASTKATRQIGDFKVLRDVPAYRPQFYQEMRLRLKGVKGSGAANFFGRAPMRSEAREINIAPLQVEYDTERDQYLSIQLTEPVSQLVEKLSSGDLMTALLEVGQNTESLKVIEQITDILGALPESYLSQRQKLDLLSQILEHSPAPLTIPGDEAFVKYHKDLFRTFAQNLKSYQDETKVSELRVAVMGIHQGGVAYYKRLYARALGVKARWIGVELTEEFMADSVERFKGAEDVEHSIQDLLELDPSDSLWQEPFDFIDMTTVMHEIYSAAALNGKREYRPDEGEKAVRTLLKKFYQVLKEGGQVLLLDGSRPSESEIDEEIEVTLSVPAANAFEYFVQNYAIPLSKGRDLQNYRSSEDEETSYRISRKDLVFFVGKLKYVLDYFKILQDENGIPQTGGSHSDLREELRQVFPIFSLKEWGDLFVEAGFQIKDMSLSTLDVTQNFFRQHIELPAGVETPSLKVEIQAVKQKEPFLFVVTEHVFSTVPSQKPERVELSNRSEARDEQVVRQTIPVGVYVDASKLQRLPTPILYELLWLLERHPHFDVAVKNAATLSFSILSQEVKAFLNHDRTHDGGRLPNLPKKKIVIHLEDLTPEDLENLRQLKSSVRGEFLRVHMREAGVLTKLLDLAEPLKESLGDEVFAQALKERPEVSYDSENKRFSIESEFLNGFFLELQTDYAFELSA